MNGLDLPAQTDLSFAPIYEEILEMGTSLRGNGPAPVRCREAGCGRSKLALDTIEQPVEWRRCRHVSVLRQRYETLVAVDLSAITHDLGYA